MADLIVTGITTIVDRDTMAVVTIVSIVIIETITEITTDHTTMIMADTYMVAFIEMETTTIVDANTVMVTTTRVENAIIKIDAIKQLKGVMATKNKKDVIVVRRHIKSVNEMKWVKPDLTAAYLLEDTRI